ncbi:copper amine oxidase N-terminal domain-containing protein [Effusibacillus lacus]|uniref:Copper amine oxidase-like N-terminal domain-containing protein n=2 Tax=Effusibacillus lacus TaxID=1348429 RepID=A0A292YT31_9BACL|nr:copper amine oxidase N-terminal domain-containing protein [Effusibacillus lacus]TCS73705.1 copper amine oxidase-like protein [Effusibacillus lacus]GAX92079.1 hypothetical protein EFBL_3770 [Effusibacillus lacus]
MVKKVFVFVLIAILLGAMAGAYPLGFSRGDALPRDVAYAEETVKPIEVLLNGQPVTFDVQPQAVNDRTYVPFRKLLEALGATVEWDESIQTAKAHKDGLIVTIPVGSKIISVQDHTLTMDVPVVVVEGRTLVPLRFVGQALGARVTWTPGEKVDRVEIVQSYEDMIEQMVTGISGDQKVSYEQAGILFEWLYKGQEKGQLPPFTGERVPEGRQWFYQYEFRNNQPLLNFASGFLAKYPDSEIRDTQFIKTKNYHIQKHDWFGGGKVHFFGYAVWDTSIAPDKYSYKYEGVEKAHYLPPY